MTALAKDLEKRMKTYVFCDHFHVSCISDVRNLLYRLDIVNLQRSTSPGHFLRTRQPSDEDSETEMQDGSPSPRALGEARENPFWTKPPKFPIALDKAAGAPRMPRRSKLRDSGICLEDDEGVFGFVAGGNAAGYVCVVTVSYTHL